MKIPHGDDWFVSAIADFLTIIFCSEINLSAVTHANDDTMMYDPVWILNSHKIINNEIIEYTILSSPVSIYIQYAVYQCIWYCESSNCKNPEAERLKMNELLACYEICLVRT